jgi:hypothetical protein
MFPSRVAKYGTQAELEERLRAHICRSVALEPIAEAICVAYVLYTWLYDRFSTAPYLHVIGDLGTGKTRLWEVLGGLCYHAMLMGGGTTLSSQFRCIDQIRGTLLMDESDFADNNPEHHDIMRMLRTGFNRGQYFFRTEGGHENWTPRAFVVFGPKIIAGRGSFPDAALESRCVPIYMRAGVDPSRYTSELPDGHAAEAADLRAQLLRWRFDHLGKPLPVVADLGFEGRIMQVYGPLAAATENAEIRAMLKAAVSHMQDELTEARRQSAEGRVLKSILALAQKAGSGAKLYMKSIATDATTASPEDGGLTPREVSAICKSFRLLPNKDAVGRYIIFNPGDHVDLLARYGLAPASEKAA